MSMGNS